MTTTRRQVLTTRRQVLKIGLAGGAGLVGYSLLGEGWAQAATGTAVLASFKQPLQVPPLLDMRGGGSYTLTATHLTRALHPDFALRPTNVWSYVGTGAVDVNATAYKGFLGPTVVVKQGQGKDVTANYVNGLDTNHYVGPGGVPWLPCDKNLTDNNDDVVRLLTHLHGGLVHGQMDGNPAVDMGYTQNQTQTVWYGNEQRAGLLWYHDHGMGNTRLNVWAGLAGAYVVRDDFDTGDGNNKFGLPFGDGSANPGQYEVPLVFQDRAFVNSATSGDMLYPTFPLGGTFGSWGVAGMDPNQYGATNGPWSAEAFGDEGLVNGLVAPFFNVEPRLYRFRCLNGCNARILDLQMVGGGLATPPPMYIIGNDGGLLPAPVKVKTLTMMPGERYDVLVDFTGYTGKVQLKNTNLNGFYASPAPRLVDFIQFYVALPLTRPAVNNTLPTTLQVNGKGGEFANPGAPTIAARTINMFEMNAMALHWWMGLIGTGGNQPVDVNVPASGFADMTPAAWNANTFHDPIGENPPENSIQEWDFINNTADSHPMHMHLVQFQVVHRRKIPAPGAAVVLPADGTLVNAWEKGWKDTVAVHPGQITRVRAKFELPKVASTVLPPAGYMEAGTSPKYNLKPATVDPLTGAVTRSAEATRCFVYHCHILEHEENDMMRPFLVT